MASPAKCITNQRNAQFSTGPSSVEGKAVARFNALKHGLDAASLVIPGEDPAELAQLAEDFHRSYAPHGPVETELVEIIIRSTWFQHRYARLEARLFDTILSRMDDSGSATLADAYYYDAAGANAFGKLFRRQNAARRDFEKALTELRRLQKVRVAMEMLQPLPPPQPAVRPAPAALPSAGPHPKPVPGEPWVGSEPLSWRL